MNGLGLKLCCLTYFFCKHFCRSRSWAFWCFKLVQACWCRAPVRSQVLSLQTLLWYCCCYLFLFCAFFFFFFFLFYSILCTGHLKGFAVFWGKNTQPIQWHPSAIRTGVANFITEYQPCCHIRNYGFLFSQQCGIAIWEGALPDSWILH